MQILHISDVEVRETKMMGTSPIIIFMVYAFILSLNLIASIFNTSLVQTIADIDDPLMWNCHSSKHSRSIVYVTEMVQ
jgi:hypothetical protein